MGPIIVASIAAFVGWEGYKRFFKNVPTQHPTKPKTLYFLQGISTGPVSAAIIASDIIEPPV